MSKSAIEQLDEIIEFSKLHKLEILKMQIAALEEQVEIHQAAIKSLKEDAANLEVELEVKAWLNDE